MQNENPYPNDCAVSQAVRMLSGKWKLIIIYYLIGGTKRFNELRRLIPGITQQMLTAQLRELEADGVISRKVYAEVPPRVEYTLTASGRQLQPILEALGKWETAHQAQVTDSRPSDVG